MKKVVLSEIGTAVSTYTLRDALRLSNSNKKPPELSTAFLSLRMRALAAILFNEFLRSRSFKKFFCCFELTHTRNSVCEKSEKEKK